MNHITITKTGIFMAWYYSIPKLYQLYNVSARYATLTLMDYKT